MKLYRNRGDGTFEDITAAAGLEISAYMIGCAVADYDGDGDADIFITTVGDNLLLETEASGPALVGPPGTEGLGTVLQGFLESSNVNPVQEITSLIAAQRAYDMNSKVISASDEMLATITQMR